jgi:hypothetical protein
MMVVAPLDAERYSPSIMRIDVVPAKPCQRKEDL